MEKGCTVVEVEVEVEDILVVLIRKKKAEVKDVCSEAVVVIGFVEGGDLVVDVSAGVADVAGVGVCLSVVSAVGRVELCGLAVDLFGVSSKSASGEEQKVYMSVIQSHWNIQHTVQ